jgi:hypothetical protein
LYLCTPSNIAPDKLASIRFELSGNGFWNDFLSGMRFKFEKVLSDESLPPASNASYLAYKLMMPTNGGFALITPRGIGRTFWYDGPDKEIHIQRRFMLLGQTSDSMRVWDTRRALQTLRSIRGIEKVPVVLHAGNYMTGIALYSALFEPHVKGLVLMEPSRSHRDGPDFLNVMRVLDLPQTVAMIAERSWFNPFQEGEDGWEYPTMVSQKLGWKDRIVIHDMRRDSIRGANSQ